MNILKIVEYSYLIFNLVRSHYLYEVNPFMILPLEHSKLQNEAEIKWLEMFHEMVDGIDFEANAKEIMKRRMEKEKEFHQ